MSLPRPSALERRERAEGRVGKVVGQRWRLDELLGVGGMAAVYAATHRNGSHVAIKILHPELAEYPDLCERFLEEGHAANRVGAPGVVAVLDEGVTDDGAPYLVMELLLGRTLEECCTAGARPSLGEVLRVADEVLAVLDRAHRSGIIHRDIKPENVFITRDGEVRVLDFGIARMADSQRTHQTEPGSAMGTPAFMPPEQARGRREAIDERTDLWALGATLFWTISGKFVHEAATVNEELLLAMTLRARSLSSVAPHVPSALVRFVDRALEFDPGSRHGSARDMRLALRAALSDVDPRALEARTGPSRSRPPSALDRRRLRARLRNGALAAALSLLGGAGWAWLTKTDVEPPPAVVAAKLAPAPATLESDSAELRERDVELLAATPAAHAAPAAKIKDSPARWSRPAPGAAPRRIGRTAAATAPEASSRPSQRDPLSRRK